MVITGFSIGKVASDPMRVPQAAAMDHGRRDSFADRLDLAARSAGAPAADDAAQDCGQCAPEAALAPAAAPPVADDAEAAPVAAPDDSTATAAGSSAATTQLPSRVEPDRRITAEEGAGSALESPSASARQSVPTGAGLPVLPAHAGAAPVAVMPALANAAATPTRTTTDRIGDIASQAPLRGTTAKAAVAGYRTLTPQGVQMNEQARDSVFKQILWKLGKDGGEMRLLLDPPELGELDLHLTVERGNTLRLSIGAERADLRDLLQSGLGDLQRALEASGLTVAHAEVHAREHGAGRRGDAAPTAGQSASDNDDSEAELAAAPRAGTGWYTAQGLDFWV